MDKKDLEMMDTMRLLDAVRELRNRGYAIAVFEPEEVGKAPPHKVEDCMVEAGWNCINYYNE